MKSLNRIRNTHAGETVFIIEAGKNFDKLDHLDIPDGPVICLNDAIDKIESLRIYNQVYVIRPKIRPKHATIISNQDFGDYEDHYDSNILLAKVDMELAIEFAKYLGCMRAIYICCKDERTIKSASFDLRHSFYYPDTAKDNVSKYSGYGDFTIITPTGDRPIQFALCQKYMNKQTFKPREWIVVDDGKVPLVKDGFYTLIRREPKITDPKHTLRINMQEAMKHVNTNCCMIIEDDDWYAPEYLAYMFMNLKMYDLFGQGRTLYYNIAKKTWHKNSNTAHASFCQTGFTSLVYPHLDILLTDESPFLDLDLWRAFDGIKHVDNKSRDLCIGLKGLGGRAGQTFGHTGKMRNQDTTLKWLKKFIGEDYANYYSC